MKRIITTLLPAIFLITACSKDQKMVQQLEGEWKVTDLKKNGISVDKDKYEGQVYSFEKCKVSKGPCNGSISQHGFSLAFTYKITNDGGKISMTTTFLGSSETMSADIIKHYNKKIIISSLDDNDTEEIIMEKI